MEGKRKYFRHFWITNISLVIPVLIAGLAVTGIVFERMKQNRENEISKQVEESGISLLDSFTRYHDETVLLSGQTELLPYRLMQSAVDTIKAVRVLQSRKNFNSDIRDVFLDIGDGKIYSSYGVVSQSLFFGEILGGNRQSAERSRKAVNGGKDTIELFEAGNESYYLLYSYHFNSTQQQKRCFNYLLSMEPILSRIFPNRKNIVYELETGNGSLMAAYNERGGLEVMDNAQMNAVRKSPEYVVMEGTLSEPNVVIRFYYEEDKDWSETGVYRIQWICIAFMLFGIVLSTLISWKISSRRIRELYALESALKEGKNEPVPEKSVFYRLYGTILDVVEKQEEGGRRIQETARQLQQEKTLNFFNTGADDRETANLFYREMGYGTFPDCYCIGVVVSSGEPDEPMMEKLPPGCLKANCRLANGFGRQDFPELNAVIFLYGLSFLGENLLERRQLGEKIRQTMYRLNTGNTIAVGISKAYTEPEMIPAAKEEAFLVIEKSLYRKDTGKYCLEDVVQDLSYGLPDQSGMERLEQALQEEDSQQAGKWVRYIVKSCSAENCSEENQEFVRFSILNVIVQYLKEQNRTDASVFLRECFDISVHKEREFLHSVDNILKKCLVLQEEDDFSNMLDYIERNYSRSDLSYEEVAEVGKVSKTYLSKMFRSRMGITYMDYLTEIRMQKACDYLKNTEYSINRIANLTGYDNLSSFGRSFKARYGVSAAQYRTDSR